MMADIECVTRSYLPRVGTRSLVATSGEFPQSFGNYFWLSNGPYIVNMWAENFDEAVRRFNIDMIAVLVMTHQNHSVGFIADARIPPEWYNSKLCVTGHGWGSRRLCEAAYQHIGKAPLNEICGCEHPDISPCISRSTRLIPPRFTDYTCRYCGRTWREERREDTGSPPTPKWTIEEVSGGSIGNTAAIDRVQFTNDD